MDETNTINVNKPPQNPLRMDPTLTRQIAIEGMTCDKCVAKVEQALRGKNGVKNVEVDRSNAVATVTFDSSQTDIPALHDALLAAGYKPTRTAGE
jgi:copper chaperone CopZ